MSYPVPKRFNLSPENLTYAFAFFNGLAYYAFILLFSQIMPFEKGIVRFLTSVLFLGFAALIFIKKRRHISGKPWPVAVNCIVGYFAWSLLSFAWSNPEGFNTQGFGMATFYFAQWLNYAVELATIILLCLICPIEKLAMNYLKGLSSGGFLLALAHLFIWLFISKASRLSAFGEGIDVLHPNNLALKLGISMLCVIHLFFIKPVRKKIDWFWFLFVSSIILPALILTVGKTVLIGFLIAQCFYLLKAPGKTWIKISLLVLSALFFTLGLPVILSYMDRYIAFGGLEHLSGRTDIWAATWEESLKHPFIGHGIASPFPVLWWYVDKAGHSGTAHNDYLNAFYQMGIVGFFIVFFMYFLFLKSSIQAGRKDDFKMHGIFCQAFFILMFSVSLTASFPVGFPVPVTLQIILHYWMSRKWRSVSYNNHFEPVPPEPQPLNIRRAVSLR